MTRTKQDPGPPKAEAQHDGGLPTKGQILDFLDRAEDRVGKREIAQAFNIKGPDRAALRDLLSEMKAEGLLERGHRKSAHRTGALPPVAVLDIVDRDVDGELLCRPHLWDREAPPPRIMLAPGTGSGRGDGRKGSTPAMGIGDRVLARLAPDGEGGYEARIIKRLGASAHRILGVFERSGPGKKADGRVIPVDRRSKYTLAVTYQDADGAKDGEVVMVEMLTTRLHGAKRARVLERFCDRNDPRAIGLIAIHSHGIPTDFPPAVIADTEAITQAGLAGRTDMRDLPLVTIDPSDARDHDDAVHAEADPDPDNPGGHLVTVAIADVAAYVTPGSALDREARRRGNSTYLPDRVVPMLPERLSADLCSLHEDVDRPCLAIRMVFTAEGRKKSHKVLRGMMRSRASLTYEAVQAAIDSEGRHGGVPEDLFREVVRPLYAAYDALREGRDKRQPLDLDLPEHHIQIGEDGFVSAVTVRERLDAHRLIEEMMIQANVAAAETLERRKMPLLYRVHDAPDKLKLTALMEFLETIGLKLAKGQTVQPGHFNRIIERAKGTDNESFLSEVILRSQSQAVYSPDNLGHFGLNLRRYAHFTSPIRRYADLIVHRGLIAACQLGTDGLPEESLKDLAAIGEEISGHERRSMAAERDAKDRFIAAFMADRVGADFKGRISGVTRFGLFVKLGETGADGFVPIRSLGNEYFTHDEDAHALVGEETGAMYRLADPVEVTLAEAAPVTGGLRFEIISEPGAYAERPKRGGGRRRRGPEPGPRDAKPRKGRGRGRK
ncbi:MAG: ribonuclease R [Alphaproteobacteria bacterium]